MVVTHSERGRWYFDREVRLGRHVILSWRTQHRWPGREIAQYPEEWIEGVVFASEDAAARFDLDRLDDTLVDGDGQHVSPWATFDTWAEAETWLRAADAAVGV